MKDFEHLSIPESFIYHGKPKPDKQEKRLFKIVKGAGVRANDFYDIEVAVKSGTININDNLFDLYSCAETDEDREQITRLLLKSPFLDKKRLARLVVDKINTYRSTGCYNEKFMYLWSMCDTLYALNVKDYLKEYLEIASDREMKSSSQMIMLLLGRIRDNASISVLIECLGDEEVNGHALSALARYKNNEKIKEAAQDFLTDKRAWVRKTAVKILGVSAQ